MMLGKSKNYEEIAVFIGKIKTLKQNKSIHYNEWRLVVNEKSKKS